MIRRVNWRLLAALVIGTTSLAAHAQTELTAQPLVAPACSSLTGPTKVYLKIGDTQEPLIKALGQQLVNAASNAIRVVYLTSGSCTNITDFFGTGMLTGSITVSYIPTTAENSSWTPTVASPTCTIDPGGQAIDVANSNVQISACTAAATPAGIGVYQGPIQGYAFVVPKASSQTAITAEEAYFVFGFGNAGGITPWNNEQEIYSRTATKSTLVSIAANIRVQPPTKMKGKALDKSTDVVTQIQASQSPETAIGILGVEVYDANRANLKTLAYRAYNQSYAFWPDSTPTATDKQNVRDGHYTIWSPTVYMLKVDGSGNPTNATAGYVVNLITGKTATPAPAFDPLSIVISAGVVPECAMKVKRDAEGGDLAPYTDPAPCGCFFDSKVATTQCKTCDTNTPCASGTTCRFGYCEAR